MRGYDLVAQVKAVNRANAHAVKLYAQLEPIFRPLVGQQIFKVDGTLLAKVAKLLPELPYDGNLMVFKGSSDYSLNWTVKTSEMVEGAHHCVYHETGVYLGWVRNHVLTEMSGPPAVRSDWTVQEVTEGRERYQRAKREADDTLSAIHPFGA